MLKSKGVDAISLRYDGALSDGIRQKALAKAGLSSKLGGKKAYEELQNYMNDLELYGEGGTDFRPAFAYVEELMEKREFENLRGLVYFTDGYGIFPAKMPPFRTAFIFMEQKPEDVDIPAWAMKLVITEEELQGEEKP